ncbi:tetratricopeptide repeat protein [Legionella drancourtii]|uniref:Uncharacterized protein n=1 Tax=Legionella drancourtii LLAP12 TaxID=658187 RepID=G9EPX7_9GAMM|nr:tetratricopeptide repeat protein [Legionella drancourtii]EHL30679.1 hypothetical protein LDG_7318 [Legionella drancourtii LLAP12]
MLTTDVRATLSLDKSAYSDEELITIISQQLFAGNYTNYSLLIDTFCSPQFKKNSQPEYLLEKSIHNLRAQCEQKSAEGCSHAMVLYGLLYCFGIGCHIDYPKAIQFLDEAIQLGNANAMNNRAYMHLHGQGGTVNVAEAIRIYEEAIQLGDVDAMNNRAWMHQYGQGGTANVAEAIRLYENAIRHGSSNAATHHLNLIEINNSTAKLLLDLIWDELLTGQSFSKRTLDSLRQFCKKDVVNRLKASPLGTSLAFLKQLKTNLQHPLTLIINESPNENNEFQSLMAHALSLHNTRVTFFCSIPANEESCPLNRLPLEMKMHLFSFVQPGLEHDKDQDYFLPSRQQRS